MRKIVLLVTIVIISGLLVPGFAFAEDNNGEDNGGDENGEEEENGLEFENLLCAEPETGDELETTQLGELIAFGVQLLLGFALLISIGGPIYYTLKNVFDSNNDSVKKRRDTLLVGIIILAVVYGVTTVGAQFGEQFDYRCVLPDIT